MQSIRQSDARGRANFGWLDSRHTFSFGHYFDPKHMGFGPLRVINEDKVTPGTGFDTHGHANMEIISYVLDGALEHKDTLGTGEVIRPGEVQRMTAGRGIRHSEFNHSKTDPVHFLQIWILPEQDGLSPSYEQRNFPTTEKRGKLRLVGSADGRDGSVKIHQDVNLYAGLFDADEQASLPIEAGRIAWVQVARGDVTVNGQTLSQGDGLAIRSTDKIDVSDGKASEILIFDMVA
ncbi:MAG: pirin family protein [Rhodospirillaceae bacterium]